MVPHGERSHPGAHDCNRIAGLVAGGATRAWSYPVARTPIRSDPPEAELGREAIALLFVGFTAGVLVGLAIGYRLARARLRRRGGEAWWHERDDPAGSKAMPQ